LHAAQLSFTLAGGLIDRRTSNCLSVRLVPESLQGFVDGALTKATDVDTKWMIWGHPKIYHAQSPVESGMFG
jgi:hypothetical protein